jgi:flagellar motor switch/type III secretory pathway protein FliN
MMARAPCPSRPLLLLSAKRRAALRGTLASCIESWRSQWSTAREPCDITVPYECEQTSPRASFAIGLIFASRKHGELGMLHADADILPSLLATAMPAEIAGVAHGIARAFLIEILRSLCGELAKRAQVDDLLIEPARVSHPPTARTDHLMVALRPAHGKARALLCLAARSVELLAPRETAQAASAQLTHRRLAVAPERVRLEAVLGNVDVPLRELIHLAVGDVIVLDQQLGRGGHLALPDGRVVAPVVVGRAGERRAVSIATQSEQRSEHP